MIFGRDATTVEKFLRDGTGSFGAIIHFDDARAGDGIREGENVFPARFPIVGKATCAAMQIDRE